MFPRLWDNLKQLASRFGQLSFQQQVQRVAIVYGIVVLVLLGTGIFLFRWYYDSVGKSVTNLLT